MQQNKNVAGRTVDLFLAIEKRFHVSPLITLFFYKATC